jgi:hypothetical protein
MRAWVEVGEEVVGVEEEEEPAAARARAAAAAAVVAGGAGVMAAAVEEASEGNATSVCPATTKSVKKDSRVGVNPLKSAERLNFFHSRSSCRRWRVGRSPWALSTREERRRSGG